MLRAETLDEQLAAVVAELDAAGVPEWHAMSVDAARRVEDEVFSGDDAPEMDLVRDVAFDGPHGDVPVRVYRPHSVAEQSEEPAPTIVYFHGGGWVLGTLDSIDGPCRKLANRADAVVFSVDYRLAPEHAFPVAVDEAAAAVEWIAANADVFGADPDRLGVAGTSAGGNLAAVAALHAREFDGPSIAGQFLLYPITDIGMGSDDTLDSVSYRENADGPLLTREDMAWFRDQYLRSRVDAANPFVSPLRAPDHTDLPPATVVTAGFDPLRDDGVAYAERLKADDVPVTHHHYPAMAHGFLSLTDRVDVAETAMERLVDEIRTCL